MEFAKDVMAWIPVVLVVSATLCTMWDVDWNSPLSTKILILGVSLPVSWAFVWGILHFVQRGIDHAGLQ